MSDDLVLAAMARRFRRFHRRRVVIVSLIVLIFLFGSAALCLLSFDPTAVVCALIAGGVLGRAIARGLVLTPGPKHRWEVHATAAGVTLVAYGASVYLPLERIVRARWIFDSDLDDDEGYEGVVHLELDTGLSVPCTRTLPAAARSSTSSTRAGSSPMSTSGRDPRHTHAPARTHITRPCTRDP